MGVNLCRGYVAVPCKLARFLLVMLPPNNDKVTAVCRKLCAVNLLLFNPVSTSLSFTNPLMVRVLSRFPLLLLLLLVNNGALSALRPYGWLSSF